jgi:hypothetical protein
MTSLDKILRFEGSAKHFNQDLSSLISTGTNTTTLSCNATDVKNFTAQQLA